MGKITANLKFCAFRTERKMRSKNQISSKDVNWFRNNLNAIMVRSSADRVSHVRAVSEFYELLEAKDFGSFYDSIPERFKNPEEKRELSRYLFELSNINADLTKEEKDILRIALTLHDIGMTPEVRNWDHNIVGEKRARALLTKLNFPQDTIDDIAIIVLNHGMFSNVGVDVFPEEIAYFPKLHIRKFLTLRSQLLIMAAMDSAGKPGSSNLTSKGLNDLLDIHINKQKDEFLWKHRLRTFFIPTVFSYTFGPRMQDQEVGIFELDKTVKNVLDKKLKVRNFSLFQLLAKNDNTYQRAVKFIKLISYITEIASKEEYFSFDTDVDFFAYEMSDRAPFTGKVERYLDRMPDEFDLETVRTELKRTGNQSCFGMPIDLTSQKLTVKLL